MSSIQPIIMENDSSQEPKTQEKEPSSILSFLIYVACALLVVVPFRIFIAQPYIVNGTSMYPTFHDADYLIVDQLSKRFETPLSGAVVIIENPKYPKENTKYFIKRLIGFPNETVKIVDGKVSIISTEHPDGLLLNEPYVKYPKVENFERKLGNDEYFVMGDNRAGSSDSRIWGPIHKSALVGTPLIRLLPIKSIDFAPGKAELAK